MKRRRFTQEQIVRILQDAEKSPTALEVIKKHGSTETTFYRWKKSYGGLPLAAIKRLKQLEQENARLKKVLTESILAQELRKEINQKKW